MEVVFFGKCFGIVYAEEEEYKYLYGTRNVMYDQEGYPELNMAGKDGQDLSWNHTSRASAGYFGRINYDYKGIYLLEKSLQIPLLPLVTM